MQEMNPQEVQEHLKNSSTKPLLLDVREPWEYDVCHIEGAQLVPMNSIPAQMSKLDPEQEIIIICHHGVRSRMVGRFLEAAKFSNLINLTGGVAAWAQSVDSEMATY
ncbi:rhodanese-like domain-containing protein [sulfur-oxidizing endosymbiont of Gigantopelta aegis]|uniref:rhodanese-like domain-containing protein n=1 Tax=sulfur-oxidizing endosymbiont of Gigantopelta aegis TaxID=2794934 RepID=UPI0018DBFE98|nr:rhodanese-like domain-containing protein [sulfur-oxidizing endosymbiont of Gigantopelta aegis]